MGLVTKEQEREFEKAHVAALEERYLTTDVLERVKWDLGYAEKIDIVQGFLQHQRLEGHILDLGANTAGEAEVLSARGHRIVATDINEYALGLSKKRANSFGRKGPEYYAADAHNLPFESESFGGAIAFEVLHHFETLAEVLKELYRVMEPGGKLFAYEPYALNPYRRFAELRFVVMGSIERSFTIRGLTRAVEASGFRVLSVERHVLRASAWKKQNVSRFRGMLKELHYAIAKRMLPIFGNIVIVAEKPGHFAGGSGGPIEAQLRCPATGEKLVRRGDEFVASRGGVEHAYPIRAGIPVLISSDATRRSTELR